MVMCSDVALLHGLDFLDVLDVAPELIGFFEQLRVLGDEELSQLRAVTGQLLSVRVVR